MEKKCTRCGEVKALSEFQVRKASKDGLTASCKLCLQNYDRSRADQPHRIEMRKAYQKTAEGKARLQAAKNSWAIRNSDRRAAQRMAVNAVRDGRIQRQGCFICGDYAEMHHSAYDYPLAVTWLCDKHHKQVHKEHRQYLRELTQ